MTTTIKVFNPYNQQLIKEIPNLSQEQALEKLEKAHQLYLDKSKSIPKYKRIEILEKISQIMLTRRESLIKTATQEGGKPWKDSEVEVDRAIQSVKVALYHLHSVGGQEIPMGLTSSSDNRTALTIKEPIGVVLSISAFNHPLNLAVHQVIPAIAAGCPVLIKPANLTPLSTLELIKICHEAGLSSDFCDAIPCDRNTAERLVQDSRVHFLSFIGSAKVGWYLRSKLSAGAHCTLEHGGVAPVIVDQTINLQEIIPPLAKGAFYHAGQVCVSVQRIYAPKNIAKTLAEELAKTARKLVVGDSLDPKTDVGPLITPKEVARVHEWVQESQGEILCGGKPLGKTTFAPTVIFNPSTTSKASTQEIFGPVVCVYSYENLEEAYQQSNSIPFSFQAAVFTNDYNTAMEASHRLKAMAVIVNDHSAFRVDWMPFGGHEQSGIGVGGIPQTIDELLLDKLIVFNTKPIH